MKSLDGEIAEHDKNRQDDALRNKEGWLRLGWRQPIHERYLLEILHDPDERLPVESNKRTDHITIEHQQQRAGRHRARAASRSARTRYITNRERRGKSGAWEQEPRGGRQDRGHEKKRRPYAHSFALQHAEDDDEPGYNSDQANDDVRRRRKFCSDSPRIIAASSASEL